MSFRETLKSLPTSAEMQSNVMHLNARVSELEELASATRSDLNKLPEALASELMARLEPLNSLPMDVKMALGAFDSVTAAQRSTLEELAQQMSTSAAQTFERKTKTLDATLQQLQQNVQVQQKTLESATKRISDAATALASLPRAISDAMQHLASMTAAAEASRPRLWRQALALVLAGTLGAALAGIGTAVSSSLLPTDELKQNAAWAAAVWSKATEQERELLKRIESRRVK